MRCASTLTVLSAMVWCELHPVLTIFYIYLVTYTNSNLSTFTTLAIQDGNFLLLSTSIQGGIDAQCSGIPASCSSWSLMDAPSWTIIHIYV